MLHGITVEKTVKALLQACNFLAILYGKVV